MFTFTKDNDLKFCVRSYSRCIHRMMPGSNGKVYKMMTSLFRTLLLQLSSPWQNWPIKPLPEAWIPLSDEDSSLDSEDDYRSGSWNISHLFEDYSHLDDHTRQTTLLLQCIFSIAVNTCSFPVVFLFKWSIHMFCLICQDYQAALWYVCCANRLWSWSLTCIDTRWVTKVSLRIFSSWRGNLFNMMVIRPLHTITCSFIFLYTIYIINYVSYFFTNILYWDGVCWSFRQLCKK